MQTARSELQGLTALRGVAALFVMAHHFLFVLLEELPKALPSHLFYKSYLWVDLFFILSGFVLAYVYSESFKSGVKRPQYLHFIWARFARIYPLHITVLLMFVLFEWVQWTLKGIGVNGAEHMDVAFSQGQEIFPLFSNALLLQTLHWSAYWNQPAWSISAEWLIYFTVPLLLVIVRQFTLLLNALMAVVVFIVLATIEYQYGTLGLDFAGWPMLLRCLGECVLGLVLYQCYQRRMFLAFANEKAVWLALALSLLLMALPISGVYSVMSFLWLVLSAARVPSDKVHVLCWSPVVYLGTVSYSIYMIHWLVLDLIRELWLINTGESIGQSLALTGEFVVFALAIIAVLILAPICHHFIEKPLQKMVLAYYHR